MASAESGRAISRQNVCALVDKKLRPLGLLLKADGSEPEVKKARPLLGLQLRYQVTDPAKTRRLTAPFAALFNPFIVALVLTAFLGVTWWVFFDKGLASAAHEAIHRPGLLLLIFVVTVLSAGFHEFGHAAAARRGGATPGVMGMGFYLFWPAFYTDVTDSYRLGRAGRLRTDLGGLYFNSIVAVGVVGAWWLSGYDALLLVVATQILQMLRQLLPMIRFDGYHVLADLTGVPDLYGRMKPVLLGLLPWRWHDPQATALKPWARIVVTLWVLLVVPIFVASVALMVVTLPRLVATAWVSLREQLAVLQDRWGSGDLVAVLTHVLSILALVVPVLGMTYLVIRLVRRVASSVWRGTAGRPVRRAVSILVAAGLVAALGWAWWPREDVYRPIAAYERGTIGSVLPGVAFGAHQPAMQVGAQGTVYATWPDGADRPTADDPALALVMVPSAGTVTQAPVEDATPTSDGTPTEAATASGTPTSEPSSPPLSGGSATSGPSTAPGTDQPRAGVFPFDLPLPPGDGDTQALAVNTTDDTVVYDVAFALVWVDDDTVTNTNEAFAAASCTNCAAVAISFQVVLVMSDADVVVPANLATAVNYDCLECLTYALASQLVITLEGPLSDESMAALQAVWARMESFAADITSVPLDDLQHALESFRDEITQIILADPSASPIQPGDESTAGTEKPGGAVSSRSDSPTTGTPTTRPPGTPTAEPTTAGDPTQHPSSSSPTETTGTPTSSPTPGTPSASPSGSASASPTSSATASSSTVGSPDGSSEPTVPASDPPSS